MAPRGAHTNGGLRPLTTSTTMPRALVTGGSGLVGGRCVTALRDGGYDVVATHRSFATSDTVYFNCADMADSVNFDVRQFRPDVIVHCAAMTNVDECESKPEESATQNVLATSNMVALAKELGAQMVFISTDYVFDGSAGPYSEDAEPSPLSVYGKHKLEAEKLVLALRGALVLRVTNVYGVEERGKNFVSRVLANAQKSIGDAEPTTLRLPSDQFATPIDAEDIAAVVCMLLRDDRSGIYHIAAAEYMSRVQLAAKVLAKVPGHSMTIDPVSTAVLGQKAPRPLKGGLLPTRLLAEYPLFACRSVHEFLSSSQKPKALPGVYAQYDQSGKHWYAPNKFEAYGEEEIQAVASCLRDGFLAPGPITEEFERQVAALFGKQYGLMVNSGSSANLLALNAFGFKPGDEVITPACTFSTVVAPLVQLGVKPVFVDVTDAYVPDAEVVLAAITSKTVLIWLPNLVGSKPDWAELRRRTTLPIWEDSCDTITVTTETDVSMTSFYASHMITAGGGGGMIMANDKGFIDKCRMYRDWGRIGNNSEDMLERFGVSVDGIPYDGKFLYGVVGYNMKSCEMNAAFGLAQLKKLEQFRKIRRANFDRFLENMKGTSYVLPKELVHSDWLAFPLRHPRRAELLAFLESNNIQTRVCFAGNITRHPAYRQFYEEAASFPMADQIMSDGFLLGCHHGTNFAKVDRACELLKQFEADSAQQLS
ncbi:hypothetical protein AB1Y20_014353 [Prymnesium parvum]|uniref:RmlD-like substrate binding domain-containing protein n=1 Tax=Prymnesium parvum TaxID=97485 RepID=A0AB34IG50_PRYPA